MGDRRSQLKRRLADRLRSEARRMHSIARQADELGLSLTGLNLRGLSGSFDRMAKHVDRHIDQTRDPRGPRRASQL
jgi:hypothetical protein